MFQLRVCSIIHIFSTWRKNVNATDSLCVSLGRKYFRNLALSNEEIIFVFFTGAFFCFLMLTAEIKGNFKMRILPLRNDLRTSATLRQHFLMSKEDKFRHFCPAIQFDLKTAYH